MVTQTWQKFNEHTGVLVLSVNVVIVRADLQH